MLSICSLGELDITAESSFDMSAYADSICYKSLLMPRHIECAAYIDRRQTDIVNSEGIYIERPVANLRLQPALYYFISLQTSSV